MKILFSFSIVSVYLLVCTIHAYGQDSLSWQLGIIGQTRDKDPIQIGQQIPDWGNHKITNYQNNTVNLENFRGKFLILDFWHQYCTSCLQAFPGLEMLQEKYKDKLVILPVTFQTEASIDVFMKKRKELGNPINFPSIVEDTILRKYFPHDGDPYDVWISKDGEVVGLTRTDGITEQRLNNVFNGDYNELQMLSFAVDYDKTKPLLINGNGGPDTAFMVRSLITAYSPKVVADGTRYRPRRENGSVWFNQYNVPPLYLFTWAFYSILPEEISYDPYNKRIAFDGFAKEDIASWIYPSKEVDIPYKMKNWFSYEFIAPVRYSDDKVFEITRKDLQQFFDVQVKIEKRKMNCLALVRTSAVDRIKTAGKYISGKRDDGTGPDHPHFEIYKQPVSLLVKTLNTNLKNLPVVLDETKYPGEIDIVIDLPKDYKTSDLKLELRKHDLDLIPVEREIDMMVLRKENESL